ncbi:MAG: hypothetical protein RIS47_2208 [Bacteroidota bacterium]|jgi:hypothetical protein
MSNHGYLYRKTTLILLSLFLTLQSFADGGLNTYYKVGVYQGTMAEAIELAKAALTTADTPFEILGEYQPSKSDAMAVIAFTRSDLVNISLQIPDMGILGNILRVGLRETSKGEIEVSLLNPEYLFYAFFRERAEDFANELSAISIDVRMALFNMGQEFRPFGGYATDQELKSFRFTADMPSFDEPVLLREFNSFDEALSTIDRNLQSRKGGSLMVFKESYPAQKVAIFGVAMHDARMGEAHFLPALGEENLACLPYELILQDNKAYILHGRYRLPLFWTNVSIRTHQKLYKTPRDIEETMRGLTQP